MEKHCCSVTNGECRQLFLNVCSIIHHYMAQWNQEHDWQTLLNLHMLSMQWIHVKVYEFASLAKRGRLGVIKEYSDFTYNFRAVRWSIWEKRLKVTEFANLGIWKYFCFLRERNLFSLFFKNVILFLFVSVEKKKRSF